MYDTQRLLTKLESLVDPRRSERINTAYRRVFAWEPMDTVPYTWRAMPPVADPDWPEIPYNDTFVDMEKMLVDQFRNPFLHLQTDDYYPLNIRANYGTVILANILGGGYQLTETSLPWAHHLPDDDAINAVIDRGVPDIRSGLGARCLDTAEYYRETLKSYPKLSALTNIYHPDLQGPFDIAHLLWGQGIFLAMYDCPDRVHQLLDVVTETYIDWLSAWKRIAGEGNDLTAHWSILMAGGTMIRNDTAVMLRGAAYDEFARPYDQRILDVFGGCIHYCGTGDQFIDRLCGMNRLYGINLSQPELNDMDLAFRVAQQEHLVILDLQEGYVPPGITTGYTLARDYCSA